MTQGDILELAEVYTEMPVLFLHIGQSVWQDIMILTQAACH